MFELALAGFGAYMGLGMLGMAVVGVALALAIFFAFIEKGIGAFAALAALAAALFYFGGADILGSARAHPALSAALVAGYFAFGAIWSLFKFRIYAGSLKNIFSEHKASWLRREGSASLEALDPAKLAMFRKDSTELMYRASKTRSYPLQPSRMKSDILFWMGWWPVSILAYLLDDPIKRLLEGIYKIFSGIYAKIAKDQAAEYLSDMGK
jgi:hypothetical protein